MTEGVIIGNATLYYGDCRDVLPTLRNHGDACITDPPYGETSLTWDTRVALWSGLLCCRSMWCFGSLRFFMSERFPNWKHAQEIIWEKHNGSIFHADRFRRVHEIATHFYKGEWADLYKSPVYTADATARTVRRKKRPAHFGHIEASSYESHDGGPRLQRSVIYARSCHGYAEHPTQKPVDIIDPLIRYSVPESGTVIDPFMGSGSTGVACVAIGRKFIGIEINRDYFDIACRRLEDAQTLRLTA